MTGHTPLTLGPLVTLGHLARLGRLARLGHLALGLALLFAAPWAAAQEDAALARCGRESAQLVQNRYGGVTDLAADFVQISRTTGPGGSQAPSASSGNVVLQVPGKMRWTYEKPQKSLVVSDGETLWLYDPGFGEAQKLSVRDSGYLSGAAIQFLLGRGRIEESFAIRTLACDDTSAELRLTPRSDASYEFLTIWVDRSQGLITRTELADLLGNRTQVEFRDVTLNQQPEASVFRFEPPPGVRVVELSTTP